MAGTGPPRLPFAGGQAEECSLDGRLSSLLMRSPFILHIISAYRTMIRTGTSGSRQWNPADRNHPSSPAGVGRSLRDSRHVPPADVVDRRFQTAEAVAADHLLAIEAQGAGAFKHSGLLLAVEPSVGRSGWPLILEVRHRSPRPTVEEKHGPGRAPPSTHKGPCTPQELPLWRGGGPNASKLLMAMTVVSTSSPSSIRPPEPAAPHPDGMPGARETCARRGI